MRGKRLKRSSKMFDLKRRRAKVKKSVKGEKVRKKRSSSEIFKQGNKKKFDDAPEITMCVQVSRMGCLLKRSSALLTWF